MSTNPFEEDYPRRTKSSSRSSIRKLQQHAMPPRPSPTSEPVMAASSSAAAAAAAGGMGTGHGGVEPAIWAARTVDWPLPSSISLSNYQKLLSNKHGGGGSVSGGVGGGSVVGGGGSSVGGSSVGGGGSGGGVGVGVGSGVGVGVGGGVGGDGDHQEEGYFSGFMRSMMNTNSSGKSDYEEERSRPLRPPRCVATANGWIVAALECPGAPLRLVSRWNVRRPSSDQILPLPPPPAPSGHGHGRGGGGVGVGPSSSSSAAAAASSASSSSSHSHDPARIMHVFCDPTGCHTLLSSKNGEAYYLHSSSRQIQKLNGFGPDTTPASGLTGVPATTRREPSPPVQTGLSIGSYITAVGWDRDRGTEGSTNSILLGTNLGEVYDYALVSPGNTDAHDGTGMDHSKRMPILLHKVHSQSMEQEIAPVTGIYFERTMSNGMIILVATSGRHKRTRLFSYYSSFLTEFRDVLSAQSFLNELPGSIDFADLYLCNDQFAMRTATGIYYGRLDRANTAPSTGIVVDAGMLPYEDGVVPVSVALTPHHFITLSESDDVLFINRVAQKVIQKERVDWITSSSSSSSSGKNIGELDVNVLLPGELLMDIRRPDQVWLRKARTLVHISSSCEDRDVWKFTLQKCLDMKTTSRPRDWHASSSRMSEDEKTQEALFEHAKSLCSTTVQKAVVTAVRAEHHLAQGRAELAAKYLAQCPPTLAPFSDTSLRLALPILGIDDPGKYGHSAKAKSSLSSSNVPMIHFLNDKMRVGKLNDDGVLCTMIGAWLAELYLHERERSGHHHDQGGGAGGGAAGNSALLQPFLSLNVNNMDAKTIMRILSSHNVSAAECAEYAAASGDVGTAVSAALSVSSDHLVGAHEALRILGDAPFEVAESFYYLHASNLLARAPLAASQSFLSRYSSGLSPTKLLPSIMDYEQKRAEFKRASREQDRSTKEKAMESDNLESLRIEGSKSFVDGVEVRIDRTAVSSSSAFVDDDTASIKYLEGVIKLGCNSSAIYSYLVSLYTAMEDEEPLWKFLSTHVPAASSARELNKKRALLSGATHHHHDDGISSSSPLDMSYTLRKILDSGRHYRSAIRLYMGFGMRQQAVELALKVDPALARDLARGDTASDEERKRLWLMIARNAAGDNRGSRDVVAKVVAVLRDCGPDVLSIEDVLPFLPDFAQIDEIKDEICDALTSYSSKIEGFLKEMNDCDQTCAALREEIGRLSSYRMQMKADARCALTRKLVLDAAEPFYVFPSGYVFLESALKKEVRPFLNEKQKTRLEEIERDLATLRARGANMGLSNDTMIDKLQAELDGLIAAECPLTGSISVESIDRPFEDVDMDISAVPPNAATDVSAGSSSGAHDFVGVKM